MEAAVSQGESAGTLVSLAPQSPAASEVINTAVSIDPTGLTTKASQVLKVLQRLSYMNINTGDKLGGFLDGVEKASPAKRMDNIELYR